MADSGIDWAALVPELEKEHARLGDLLSFARMKAGMTATGPERITMADRPASLTNLGDLPTEIRPDTFFGMTIADAIKTYLAMVKRPQRAAEIARALDSGGLLHSSRNWLNTVQSTLTRQKGDLVKLPTGWGLAEWYPGRSFGPRRGQEEE